MIRVLTSYFWFLLLVLAPAAFAGNGVEISEVGLGGYYSTANITPVRAKITVPPDTTSIQLRYTVNVTSDVSKNRLLQTDHFSRRFPVNPGETVELEMPLFLTRTVAFNNVEHSELDLAVIDSGGRLIGRSGLGLGSLTQADNNPLIVMICSDRTLCDAVQSQISFSGTEEEASDKNKNMKFLALSRPRANWWDYSAAGYLVVAAPVNTWTPAQRSAVELYLRGGGRLILMEKEASDPTFLGAYRGKTGPVTVGQGTFYPIAEVTSNLLGPMFIGTPLKGVLNQELVLRNFDTSFEEWLRSQVAVSFKFPRLRWLLLWMTAYILVVGLVNFVALSRMRRMEWGWVTTTIIAVVFAAGFYVASSTNRPKTETLDELSIYWMDSHSGIASKGEGIRVSSPRAQLLSLAVSDDALFCPHNFGRREVADAQIAADITDSRHATSEWELEWGPPGRVEVPVLRWSFVDFRLRGFRTFPGTVTVSSDMRLKNETGQRFREAVFLDLKNNKRYPLPSLAPNQEVGLNSIVPAAIWINRGDKTVQYREWLRPPLASKTHFSLSNMEFAGYLDQRMNFIFVGINDESPAMASLEERKFVRKDISVTVVAVDKP